MNQIVAENQKLKSDVMIFKNDKHKLEEKIVDLEKDQQKESNTAAEATWRYQAYQTGFLLRILKTQQ